MARLKTHIQASCWRASSRVLRDEFAGKPHKAAIWGHHTCLRGKTRDAGAVEKAEIASSLRFAQDDKRTIQRSIPPLGVLVFG